MKVCGQKMGGGGGRGVPAKLLTVHCQMPLLSFLVSCAAAANEIQQATKEGMADVPDTPGETGHRLGGGLQRAQKSLHFDNVNVNVSTDVTRAAGTSGGETDDRDVSLDESSSSETDPSIVGSAVDSGAASSAPAADAGRPTESNMSALRTLTPTEFDALLRMFIALGTKYGSKKQTERTKWDGYSPGVHFTSNAQLKVFCGHGTALEMLEADACRQKQKAR